MEQINTFGIYLLGKWLDSVFLQARGPVQGSLGAWRSAQGILELLIDGGAKIQLDESRPAARGLRNVIANVIKAAEGNPDYVMSELELGVFNHAWGQFENSLALDLGRAPYFFVTRKGIFDTDPLINAAELALTEDVFGAISDPVKKDINQAGRCLAFGIWTASGYHALRATEKVLRDWYELVTGNRASFVGMKQAIDELRKAGAHVKTLAVFDQLRDLHRNPIDHPEIFLEKSEAMELFNMCSCAISAAARQLTKLTKPGPETEPAGVVAP